jgi:hypothetical protein
VQVLLLALVLLNLVLLPLLLHLRLYRLGE